MVACSGSETLAHRDLDKCRSTLAGAGTRGREARRGEQLALRGDFLVFSDCDLERASLAQAKLTDCDLARQSGSRV